MLYENFEVLPAFKIHIVHTFVTKKWQKLKILHTSKGRAEDLLIIDTTI